MMILLGSKAIVWILLIRTNALRAPETLKRKLFEDVDVLSTNRHGGLPGHFTSQHVEGAANLCAEPRPVAKTFCPQEELSWREFQFHILVITYEAL